MSEIVATPTQVRTLPALAPGGLGSMLQRLGAIGRDPAVRRALPMLGVVALVAAAFLLWSAFSRPAQRDLFMGLDDADKAAVANTLGTAGIAYGFEGGSGALTVAESDYYRAKMLAAQAGLPKGAPDAQSVMGSLPMGASRAVEGERLRTAREMDLARTIEAIDAVETARVHIAVDQPSVFLRDTTQAAASVMLKMRGSRVLADNQVQAIANLVGSSVPGLSADAVSIVDQSGRLLSRAGHDPESAIADRQLGMQAQVESRYADALDKILAPIVGAGNYTAEVHADLDFAESQATRESYPKETQTLRSETGGFTKDAGGGAAAGIPGALSNMPPPASTLSTAPVAAQPGTSAAVGEGKTSETYNRDYALGREVSVTRNPSGTVKRLSVAVALKDAKGARRTKAEIAALEGLVKGAVGFDAARGDTIAISARDFASLAETAGGPGWWEAPWVSLVARNVTALAIAALLIFGIGKPLLARRAAAAVPAGEAPRARAKIGSEIAAALASSQAAAPAGSPQVTLDMIESAPGYSARAALIRNFVKQDPARAALVVRDLIRADGGREDRNG